MKIGHFRSYSDPCRVPARSMRRLPPHTFRNWTPHCHRHVHRQKLRCNSEANNPTRAIKTTVERLFSLSTSENRIPAFLLARGPSSAGRVLSRLRLAGGGCRRAPIVRLRGRRSVRSGVVFVVVWPIRGVCCFLIAPRTNDA